MTAALDEVERRLRGGLRGVASAEARITSTRTRDDLVRRARDKPSVLGAAGVALVSAIGFGVYTALKSRREAERPRNRLRRGLLGARNEVEGRVRPRVEESRRQLDRARPHALLVRLEPQSGGFMRLTEARLERPADKTKERNDVIKKLAWAALLSVFMALSSVVARRVAGSVWKATVSEDPPSSQRNE
jgi:hypothetical protein